MDSVAVDAAVTSNDGDEVELSQPFGYYAYCASHTPTTRVKITRRGDQRTTKRSKRISPTRHQPHATVHSPTKPQPIWRSAHDPSYPGLRSELAAQAVFLDDSFELVNLEPTTTQSNRPMTATMQPPILLQQGNEELRRRLKSMKDASMQRQRMESVLHPTQEKYSSQSAANLRIDHALRSKRSLINKFRAQLSKHFLQQQKPSLHQVEGFIDGDEFDLKESSTQMSQQADEYATKKAFIQMEREVVPPRVGLPFMTDVIQPSLLAASNKVATAPVLAHTQSTPNLRSPIKQLPTSNPPVTSTLPSPATTLDTSPPPTMSRPPSIATLKAHFSPTGKLVPRDEPILSPTSNVHVASLSNLISSSTVLQLATGEKKTLSSSASESLLSAPANYKYQPIWAKTSKHSEPRKSTSPQRSHLDYQERFQQVQQTYQQLPPEYQAFLSPPQINKNVLKQLQHKSQSLSPSAIHQRGLKKAQQHLSPLKVLMSTVANQREQNTENGFNQPPESNPYTSLLLGPQLDSHGSSTFSSDEKESDEPAASGPRIAYYDENGRFFSWSQPPSRINTSQPLRMRISSPTISEKDHRPSETPLLPSVSQSHLNPNVNQSRGYLSTPGAEIYHLPSSSGSTTNSSSQQQQPPPSSPYKAIHPKLHDMSSAYGARPKYLAGLYNRHASSNAYSHTLASLDTRATSSTNSPTSPQPPTAVIKSTSPPPKHIIPTSQSEVVETSEDSIHPQQHSRSASSPTKYLFGSAPTSSVINVESSPLSELTEEVLTAHVARAEARESAKLRSIINDSPPHSHGWDGDEATLEPYQLEPYQLESESTAAETDAAIRIQSIYRGFASRKQLAAGQSSSPAFNPTGSDVSLPRLERSIQ